MSDNVTIDGKEYPRELLSDKAKANLVSLQFVDRKIFEAQQDLAILKTARSAYANTLKAELPEENISI
jgi:hypothetical protein